MKMAHMRWGSGRPRAHRRLLAARPSGRLRLAGGCGGASSNRRSTPIFSDHGASVDPVENSRNARRASRLTDCSAGSGTGTEAIRSRVY